MNLKNFSLIKVVLCVAALTMVMVSPAFALPKVDGKISDSDGYASSVSVSFDIKNGPAGVTGGTLWTFDDDDTDTLYFGLILPLEIIENTPEISTQGYIDTYNKDNLEFKYKYGPTDNEIKLKLDYIEAVKDADDNITGASARVEKFEHKTPVYDENGEIVVDKKGKIETETTDLDASTIAFSTSLDYNLNNTDDSDYFWINEIMYEFSIEKDVFENAGIDIDLGEFLNLDNSKIKAESNKLGDKDVYPTAPVPEPATMLLLGTGLVGLAGFRRKKLSRK